MTSASVKLGGRRGVGRLRSRSTVQRYIAGEYLRNADAVDDPETEARYEQRALELLQRAGEGGYRDFEELRGDPKLERRLRSRPEFEALLAP